MTTPLQIVAYRACLPPKNKKQEKVDALVKFCRGVIAAGDNAYMHEQHSIVDADVAVILGWVHEESKNSHHLQLRKKVVETQLTKNKHVVVIDSNLFLYKDTKNPLHYLRYSFNGVFPNTGIYCDSTPSKDRWDSVSGALGLSLKPYRTQGNHILLCLQRQGGWSMGGIDIQSWVAETISKIRSHSGRPIRLRLHPGDKIIHDFSRLQSKFNDVSVSVPGSTLLQDLNNCWAVVNHNSSPTVGAAIEGYPIFVTDPVRSQCQEIANIDLSTIESPILYEREQWAARLSMFHWGFNELESGQCWRHMRQYLLGS